jgi:hypothetical protein
MSEALLQAVLALWLRAVNLENIRYDNALLKIV